MTHSVREAELFIVDNFPFISHFEGFGSLVYICIFKGGKTLAHIYLRGDWLSGSRENMVLFSQVHLQSIVLLCFVLWFDGK